MFKMKMTSKSVSELLTEWQTAVIASIATRN